MASRYQDTDSGYRPIRPGRERFNHYFPSALGGIGFTHQDISIEQDVALIQKIIGATLEDTRRISREVLKGKTLAETCRNIYEFWYNYIQYELDAPGKEQVRRPARTWKDGKADCDCFAVAVSSCLTNLGIAHSLRIAKYLKFDRPVPYVGGWQHIYVIVPDEAGRTIVIDCVLSPFGYEKPTAEHKDYPMPAFEYLNGAPSEKDMALALIRQTIEGELANYRNMGKLLSPAYDAATFVRYAQYALDNWSVPARRDSALTELARREQEHNNLAGFGAISLVKKKKDQKPAPKAAPAQPKAENRGFFTAIKNTVDKVEEKVKTTAAKVKDNVTQGDGKLSLKDVGRTLMKVTPVVALARTGVRAFLHLNMFGIAEKLRPGLVAGGPANASRAVNAVEKLWNGAGGDIKNLHKALQNNVGAKKAGLKGWGDDYFDLEGLGEPVTASAMIAAAMPMIMKVLDILKKEGLLDKIPSMDEVRSALGKNESQITSLIASDPETDTGAGAQESQSQGITNRPNENDQPTLVEKVGDFTSSNPMLIVGGVLAVGGLIWYAVADNDAVSSLPPKERAEVMKRRAEAQAVSNVAAALSGPKGSKKRGNRRRNRTDHKGQQATRKTPQNTHSAPAPKALVLE